MGELLLCGLGPRPPEQTTFQVLEALRSCDAVFGPSLSPFLETKKLDADKAVALAKKGKRVGVGFAGHPIEAETDLEKRARAAGVPVRRLPGMTPFGAALAAEGRPLGWRRPDPDRQGGRIR